MTDKNVSGGKDPARVAESLPCWSLWKYNL